MFVTRRTLETLHQRLTNDFLTAEALSIKVPRDEKTTHLLNSTAQSDITRRQAYLIMQLRDFLVAKGESPSSIIEVLTRHADGIGPGLCEILEERQGIALAMSGAGTGARRPVVQGEDARYYTIDPLAQFEVSIGTESGFVSQQTR